MQTGKKEAKLLDETEQATETSPLITTDQSGADNEEGETTTNLNYSELKEALKKIKNDANKDSVQSGESSSFRSYEEIKEEMKKIEQSIKTEYEIVKELVSSYMNLEEDSARKFILNDLEFYVHQYDNAQDFVKMGGFRDVVLPALNSTNTELRSSAAFLLGNCISTVTGDFLIS